MSCKEGKYFAGGLFIGAAAGAVCALLLAPKSGEEMREELRGTAEETFDDLRDQAIEYSETVKAQFEDMTDALTDKINQYREQIEAKIQEIQDEVNQDIVELNEELDDLNKETDEIKDSLADDEGE